MRDQSTRTNKIFLTVFQRLYKQSPFFSKFYSFYNQHCNHSKTLTGHVYDFSINEIHQYKKDQNTQKLYMPDFELKPIHKLFSHS